LDLIMDSAGQQASNAAIFAAEGAARHRMVRAAIAGGIALVVAWLIALVLGVLGGFGSLPVLPGADSHGTRESASATSTHRAEGHVVARRRSVSTAADRRRTVTGTRAGSRGPVASPPKPRTPQVTPTSAASPSTAGSSNGRAFGTTRSTTAAGKPVGSPGNGPGGGGAPGQLR
jgi:hypothetical protein